MKKAVKIRYYIESLSVYDFKQDEIIGALYDLLRSLDDETVLVKQSRFFKLLTNHKSFRHYVSKLILTDDNAFTKAAAAGECDSLDGSILDGVKSDLYKLEEIAGISADDICDAQPNEDIAEILKTMPKWNPNGRAMLPLTDNWCEHIDDLKAFHKTNGYGMFAKFVAFTWRNEDFVPISSVDPISLNDLKNYEIQRQKVIDNTQAFIQNLPANNVLLYGDRGTGKSSTVHAILNEYKNQGLRMIEISKGDINDLTMIREKLSDSPMKFIIFIDDLSFDSHDDSFGELKAALEGSLSGRKSHILIYATSNRRHLIKENFSDRENDVNRSDTLQEELSLSDRFGLSITFVNPDKADYLDIVEKIARDRELECDYQRLFDSAEQWARKRAGRSPRCAKQFIDYVEGCIKRGIDW